MFIIGFNFFSVPAFGDRLMKKRHRCLKKSKNKQFYFRILPGLDSWPVDSVVILEFITYFTSRELFSSICLATNVIKRHFS